MWESLNCLKTSQMVASVKNNHKSQKSFETGRVKICGPWLWDWKDSYQIGHLILFAAFISLLSCVCVHTLCNLWIYDIFYEHTVENDRIEKLFLKHLCSEIFKSLENIPKELTTSWNGACWYTAWLYSTSFCFRIFFSNCFYISLTNIIPFSFENHHYTSLWLQKACFFLLCHY